MPSTSQEVRDEMAAIHHGVEHPNDSNAIQYLESRGFHLNRDWSWTAPAHYRSIDDLTNDEYTNFVYLVEEWDFGPMTYMED